MPTSQWKWEKAGSMDLLFLKFFSSEVHLMFTVNKKIILIVLGNVMFESKSKKIRYRYEKQYKNGKG